MRRDTIKLRGVKGKQDQEAYIINAHFATFKTGGTEYHKGCPVKADKPWWNLTHIPTGCTLGKGPTRKDAINTARILSEKYGAALDSDDPATVGAALKGQAQNIKASLYGLDYEPTHQGRNMALVFGAMREALHDKATW